MRRKTTNSRELAHTRYRLADGSLVPGVTSVLSILAKPALVPWANKLGLEGIDVTRYVDERAAIGTLAHQMILDHLCGRQTDVHEYSSAQIDAAENSYLSYLSWEQAHRLTDVLLAETPLVSESHRYGGTLDALVRLDQATWLIDFKTGAGIYDEHVYQVAALRHLLEEHGYSIDGCRILLIPRSEDTQFTDRVLSASEVQTGWAIFLHCLAIHTLKRGG